MVPPQALHANPRFLCLLLVLLHSLQQRCPQLPNPLFDERIKVTEAVKKVSTLLDLNYGV